VLDGRTDPEDLHALYEVPAKKLSQAIHRRIDPSFSGSMVALGKAPIRKFRQTLTFRSMPCADKAQAEPASTAMDSIPILKPRARRHLGAVPPAAAFADGRRESGDSSAPLAVLHPGGPTPGPHEAM
jgi:hypothetical protein